MRLEKLEQKIYDLNYRIYLDELAIKNADYNLKFSKRLNYNEETVDSFKSKLDFYNSRIAQDKCTLNVLTDCIKNSQNGGFHLNDDYLFKCTLPYEKVDEISSYQTSITVSEDVARLFANGVSYKDVISCLDNEDIKQIESNFASTIPQGANFKNVGVEIIEKANVSEECLDEPIVAKVFKSCNSGLIASSKIPACYSFGSASYNDLNGACYTPGVPTFEEIFKKQNDSFEKEMEYNNMVDLEDTVKSKMQASIDKVTIALDKAEEKYKF